MATAAITYTFVAGEEVVAAENNQNFTDLVNFLNTYCVQTNGLPAFTGIPSGPTTDPTTDNQFTRKAYVDNKAGGVLGRAAKAAFTTASLATDTYADITDCTVTVDLEEDHWYMAGLHILSAVGSADGEHYRLAAQILQDATSRVEGYVDHRPGAAVSIKADEVWQAGADDAGVVFKARVKHRAVAAGTVTIDSAVLWVIDLGL